MPTDAPPRACSVLTLSITAHTDAAQHSLVPRPGRHGGQGPGMRPAEKTGSQGANLRSTVNPKTFHRPQPGSGPLSEGSEDPLG